MNNPYHCRFKIPALSTYLSVCYSLTFCTHIILAFLFVIMYFLVANKYLLTYSGIKLIMRVPMLNNNNNNQSIRFVLFKGQL